MSDAEPPQSSNSEGGVPSEYPMQQGSATLSLRELMAEEIRRNGPMPMPRYMELALYHPQWGYYATGERRVGKEGDFFTSVSVGPLFGALLARRLVAIYGEMGRPPRWRVVEVGANDGRLAADIVRGVGRIDGKAAESLDYVIREPLPTMREIQRDVLSHVPVRVMDPPEIVDLEAIPGVVFGNEVLDALPFHWIERCGDRWLERGVGLDESGRLGATRLGVAPGPIGEFLSSELDASMLPDGWQCELRGGMEDFLTSSMQGLLCPKMIWIDYGFERRDLWHPARTTGTWQAFRGHRLEPEPWDLPGACDLTAHVDFTQVIEVVERVGGEVVRFENQGPWLTRLATGELAVREGVEDPAWVRQFQTLTHPAQLGGKFRVMECQW